MFTFLKKQQSSKVIITGESATLEIPRGKTMLEAMLADGLAMPHDCKVGSCGTCRFKLVEGKIGELSPSALVLERDALSQGYRLACQAMPRSDLVIALDAPLSRQQAVERFSATIVATPRLCPDIIQLVVELDRPIRFIPGQYADLTAPGIAEPRSYSFAFAPDRGEATRLEFHVRHVPGGLFTDWLFGEERTGGTLELSGPFGQFRLKDSTEAMLCLAGGSGLAPIMAILQHARSLGASRPVTLLYGARTQQHLYCLGEIEALRSAWNAPFEFIPVLSEEDERSGWTGARGLVTDPIARLAGLARTEAYLCGPPAMIDAAEAQLVQQGVLPELVAADRFLDKSTTR